MDKKYRQKWTEEETILAFYYYCRIPFGKISHRNPEIIRIAELIGRTPSSVSMKMGNLGHFDPSLQGRQIVGMSNASKLDEQIVRRFFDNWEDLSYLAQQIEEKYQSNSIGGTDASICEFPLGADIDAVAKKRVNQQFFRDAVLCSYQQRCCISGLEIPSLLIASHIKPWAVSDPRKERTNPSNGLCLNMLHDKAFDRGLITVLPDYTIRVSEMLRRANSSAALEWLLSCDKQKIILPERFLPAREFLEYHNDVVFESGSLETST